MNTPHTAGPWTHTPGQDTIWAQDGSLLIARTEYTRREMDVFEDEANARLIAAAPDLLHHLRILAEEDSQCARDWVQKKKAARAAIAKAEGAP